ACGGGGVASGARSLQSRRGRVCRRADRLLADGAAAQRDSDGTYDGAVFYGAVCLCLLARRTRKKRAALGRDRGNRAGNAGEQSSTHGDCRCRSVRGVERRSAASGGVVTSPFGKAGSHRGDGGGES